MFLVFGDELFPVGVRKVISMFLNRSRIVLAKPKSLPRSDQKQGIGERAAGSKKERGKEREQERERERQKENREKEKLTANAPAPENND